MDPNVISKPEKSLDYEDEPSLGHLVIKKLSEAGDKTILISGITSDEITANDLLEKSIAVAKSLTKSGIQPGNVISIVSENRFEFAYVLFGSLMLNCTFAPINLTYTEREMLHAFNLSKPKIVFMSPFASQRVVNVTQSLSFVKKIVLFEDENPFGRAVDLFKNFIHYDNVRNISFSPKLVDKSRTVAVILCSSGTTGLPKGVQLSQSNLIVVTRFCKNTVLRLANFEDERTILGLIPWFHAFGLTTLTGVIASASAKIVLLPKFEEGLFLSCIENYHINVLFLVPPLMVFLAKHPLVDAFDLSSIRIVIVGAAPLSKELVEAVDGRLRNPELRIRQGYGKKTFLFTEVKHTYVRINSFSGMSELSLSVLLQKSISKTGSVGDINEGSLVKIIDENGKSLGPNQHGELCFKGNQLMMGYVGDEKSTMDTIDKYGWLHSGDVGYYDEDKQFYIVDRIKELIKWKGYQVPPAEIEGLLLTHHKIKDAAVIGIPDEVAGELPTAFVVKADKNLTAEEVIQFVAKTASPAKRLHGGVRFVNDVPRNPSGKILRRELRELAKSDIKSKL